MRYYPLFLNLQLKSVLIVGAGRVGQRKTLIVAKARPQKIVVVDPVPMPSAFFRLSEEGRLQYMQRGFLPSDIQGAQIVFAATNSESENNFIAELCETQNILCNAVDAPDKSDFIVPSLVRKGPLTIAISTQGASPALARHLRSELDTWMGDRYTRLALLLDRLRPHVLTLPGRSEDHAALFHSLINSPLGDLLMHSRLDQAREILHTLLPVALHSSIGELLHEL